MIRIILLSLSLFLSPVEARTEDSWTTDDLDIYTTVLRFFTPPRNQVRWIGLEMISRGETMPAAMRDSLIRRLGHRFEGWSIYHESDPRSGGRINLSSIHRFTPDSVSVTARYQHRTEYHENSPFTVRFFIVKRDAKWVLIKP
jgi:hypothetical protein